jgi:hypothetical protein
LSSGSRRSAFRFGGQIDVSQVHSIAGRLWLARRVMMVEQPGYLAYMLRMWRVEAEDGPAWRASLESPHTGERVRFGSPEALFAFLVEKTGRVVRETQPRAKPEGSGEAENKT